jgi:hypothetical protein
MGQERRAITFTFENFSLEEQSKCFLAMGHALTQSERDLKYVLVPGSLTAESISNCTVRFSWLVEPGPKPEDIKWLGRDSRGNLRELDSPSNSEVPGV